MGLKFGNLIRIVGITYYSLSPHEQRALAGVLNPGIKNVLRRTRDGLFIWGVPVLMGVIIVKSANEYHYKINRKDPGEFAQDV